MKMNRSHLHQAAQWALRHTTSFLTGGLIVLTISTAYSVDLPTFVLPNTFTNNTIADATQVNANFTKLKDEILVNRTAINNLHFAVMANGVNVGVLSTFQPFSTVSSVSGQNSKGYSFAVDQNGGIATSITDASLSLQTINTSNTCAGSAQPTLLVKVPSMSAKTVYKINLGVTPVGGGDLWSDSTNPWNGTYSFEGTEPTFNTVSNYVLNSYSQCNATQTFTGPFFTPITYVHSSYNAPNIAPLGLTPNNQTNTGVPNGGFTGPMTIKIQHD